MNSSQSLICKRTIVKGVIAGALSATITLMYLPLGYAQAVGDIVGGPVNSTQNGQIVQGGTYYNTSDSRTTFTNTGSGGLWLKSGTTVRGLEVDPTNALTGNGGTLHFYAPGSVVRIDGTIDVNALRNGNYLGNGGRVFVDSAFLYQNGSIFANGGSGGLVQMNVGSAVFGTGLPAL